MNIANINKVIDHLERMRAVGNIQPFDMSSWFRRGSKPMVIIGEDDLPATPSEAAHLLAVMEGAEFIPPEDRFKCDTVACIAGHTALVADAEGALPENPSFYAIREIAQSYLGLDRVASNDLFIPSLPQLNEEGALERGYLDITIEDAIFALKALRDTGEVNWPFAFHPRGGHL